MGNAAEILLVEDNPNDAELAVRALKKNNLANNLIHLEDGQEALDYLYDEKNEMPKLILMDVKMPRVDGIEVLRKLKSDEKRRVIPVVMLTSSKEDKDIIEAYNLGVNAYIVKPVDFDQFVKAVTQLGFFWMILNQPPQVNKVRHRNVGSTHLSARELEILLLICQELTPLEISKRLQISEKTFFNHRANVLSKVNARGNVGLVKYAYQQGIIELPPLRSI